MKESQDKMLNFQSFLFSCSSEFSPFRSVPFPFRSDSISLIWSSDFPTTKKKERKNEEENETTFS